MNEALELLHQFWLAGALVVLAFAFLAVAIIRLSLRTTAFGWLVAHGGFLLAGFSALFLSGTEFPLWIAGGALVGWIVAFAVLLLTGEWSRIAGCALAALSAVGLGGLLLPPLTQGANAALRTLASARPLYWPWLSLLLLVPLIVWLSYRSLSGLGPTRKWLAIGLRCLGVLLLVLALAETQVRREGDNLTVLFLWDRSLSVPREMESGEDAREKRIRDFINLAVARRGAGHERDQAGVIVFGRWPRLEVPPSDTPKLNLTKISSDIDRTYTDIGSAIKLALACFPEGTGKRIVLISDGNQNLGDAVEQARIARHNGVQIDVVPLAVTRQKQSEVLVERVEAPSVTEKDAHLPLRIILRSHHPQPVAGMLTLTRTSLQMRKAGEENQAEARTEPILETQVTLRPGLNTFYFQQPGSKAGESYIFEAKFTPKNLPGDRFENNRAEATVVARGQRAVLLIEPNPGEHQVLVDRLRQARSSLKVVAVTPEALPQNTKELAVVLSRFDCVILANVPAERLSEQQQKVIRSNTHEQGAGLIMIGGPQGFGAGGWTGTEIEKALPVTCDLKSTKVEGKSGLVLIMHASEIAQGNMWQKKVAKLAIERLGPADMVGLLYYDWGAGGGGHKWHIPFQQVGENRAAIYRLLDSMQPGDMPDAEPSLLKARDALSDPKYALGTKHIIFISDGDHWSPPVATLRSIRDRKITCTTVCITSHGQAEYRQMATVAALTRGRAYPPPNPDGSFTPLRPEQLPAIYIKESRLVSKSFIYQKTFTPQFRGGPSGPMEGIPKDLEPLHGFVRTTKRPSPLVSVPILTPQIGKEEQYPVLAYWQYGLGRAVAFTSDAVDKRIDDDGKPIRAWDQEWINSPMYTKFWEQLVEWSMRSVESGKNITMLTEQRDGKLRITVDARDDKNLPLTNIKLEAGVTGPELKDAAEQPSVKFEQVNAGVYEAEIKADEVGAYFIHVRATWKDKDGNTLSDSVRSGVSVPYSPEFADMTSNVSLLEQIAQITDGNVYADSEEVLARAVSGGDIFRALPIHHLSWQPVWPWLVLLAAVCLLGDVAVRRIAVEPAKVIARMRDVWASLRGTRVRREQAPEFLDRLKSRKSRIGEGLDKARAVRRFEGGDVPVEAPPTAAEAPVPSREPLRRSAEAPQIAAEQEQEPADFASRLMKAKKKVWEERDKDKK